MTWIKCDTASRLAAVDVEPMAISQQQFDKDFRHDVAASTELVKAANIQARK
ncbi:MAG TPA: hypothetical protein VFI98_03850 [Pseudolabrys sp.]|nr:hypothetical protein [Pseudolabrys sp.]